MANTKITSRVLADDAVLTANITDANVTTAKIAADAITGAKIADDAINSEHYTDGSIDTAHIADAQITTAKITDANVTTAKIADDAVTSAKLDTNIDIAGTFDVTGATTLDSTLGIGVASPEGIFEIEDGGTSKDILQKITLDDDNLYGLVIGNDSFSTTLADGFAVTVGNSGLVGLQARGSGSQLQFRTASTERLLIDAAGDVTLKTAGKRYYVPRASDGAATGSLYSPTGNEIRLSGAGSSSGVLSFEPSSGSGVAAHIDNAGKVGIGNTNPSDYSADANNLVVGSLTGNNGITILSTPSAGYGSIYFADATTNNKVYAGYIRYQQDNSIMTFGINETERMRIQLGGGISFNGDTATANALDDYEEGTFDVTASIAGASGAITFTSAANSLGYTKIGDVVHISGYLIVDANSASGGRVNITGFPFTSKATSEGQHAAIFHAQILAGGTGTNTSGYACPMESNSVQCQVKKYNGITSSNDGAQHLASGAYLYISGFYTAA